MTISQDKLAEDARLFFLTRPAETLCFSRNHDAWHLAVTYNSKLEQLGEMKIYQFFLSNDGTFCNEKINCS